MQIRLEVLAQLLTDRQTNNEDYMTFLAEVIIYQRWFHKCGALLVQYKCEAGALTLA